MRRRLQAVGNLDRRKPLMTKSLRTDILWMIQDREDHDRDRDEANSNL